MKKVCADITLIKRIGKRIKEEAQNRGYSNQDMADLLHYSSSKQISPFYSGKKMFSAEQINIIANTFGVRKDYLLCIDDYKTDDDLLQGEKDSLKEKYKYMFSFLRSIGYTVELSTKREAKYNREVYNSMTTKQKNKFWEDMRENNRFPISVNNLYKYFENDLDLPPITDEDTIIDYQLMTIRLYEIRVVKNNHEKYFNRDDFIKFTDAIIKNTEFILNTFF